MVHNYLISCLEVYSAEGYSVFTTIVTFEALEADVKTGRHYSDLLLPLFSRLYTYSGSSSIEFRFRDSMSARFVP